MQYISSFQALIWNAKGWVPVQAVCMLSPEVMSNSATPWMATCQAPLSMGFSRQEYWFLLLVSHHVRLFCNPIDCSLPGSSVQGISQARILEWVAISFSRGSSQPRNQTFVSCISRWILYHWATREALWGQGVTYSASNRTYPWQYIWWTVFGYLISIGKGFSS